VCGIAGFLGLRGRFGHQEAAQRARWPIAPSIEARMRAPYGPGIASGIAGFPSLIIVRLAPSR
jgi:hypothetical protein